MINTFDTEVAVDVGINAAVIYQNIQYWCEKNRANGQNEEDGLYWTYNSIKAFCEQFPYLTEKQIRVALGILEEKGYIRSGNFNRAGYDRTKWYADLRAGKGRCICPGGQMDLPCGANGIALEGKPIPNINTDINTDNNIYNEEKPKKKKFVPPTVEEVAAYCKERGNNVDPVAFVAYYEGTQWCRGKTKISNWKACVITWERNESKFSSKPKPSGNAFTDLKKQEGYI